MGGRGLFIECSHSRCVLIEGFHSIWCVLCMSEIIEEPAPEVAFEFSVYTVPENDLTMPLCVDVSIAVTEATAYTITAMQSEFQRAECMCAPLI